MHCIHIHILVTDKFRHQNEFKLQNELNLRPYSNEVYNGPLINHDQTMSTIGQTLA